MPNTLRESLQQAIVKAKLPEDFISQIESIYLPLAKHVDTLSKRQTTPLILSLQGPQGAGKSTLCYFLQQLLEQQFQHRLAVLSLDDFYYDSDTREQLAEDVHPLLKTRGVPGTHDLALAIDTLTSLKAGKITKLPRFNKAEDNPYDQSNWPDSPDNVTIILFEGWCNNLPPQAASDLLQPINALESEEDHDGRWRKYVNQQLEIYDQQLFDMTDALLCLTIPSFELVYQWRGLQEDKLRQASEEGSRVMDKQQVIRFIQHFERLSRHAMTVLPEIADMVLTLDDSHRLIKFSVAEED